jgi:hypothetical protein
MIRRLKAGGSFEYDLLVRTLVEGADAWSVSASCSCR